MPWLGPRRLVTFGESKGERDMAGYVTELTCIHCGASYPGVNLATAEATWMVCPHCGPADGILDIGYDLDRVRAAWNAKPIASRPLNHWRYAELLPLEPSAIRHDWPVGWTPVLDATAAGPRFGNSANPAEGRRPQPDRIVQGSGQFRRRRTRAAGRRQNDRLRLDRQRGQQPRRPCGPGRFAGLYLRARTRRRNRRSPNCKCSAPRCSPLKASYDAAYDLCTRACHEFGWYNRNCAINPVLVEGKKTAGLEVAEQSAQFGGVPDWVAVSVGDGCTIAGIWKGLRQMHDLGVIDRLPRLLAVQAEHVNPIEYALTARRAAQGKRWKNDRRQHRRPRAAQLAKGRRCHPRSRRRASSPPATRPFWTPCGWPGGTACSPNRPRPRHWRASYPPSSRKQSVRTTAYWS